MYARTPVKMSIPIVNVALSLSDDDEPVEKCWFCDKIQLVVVKATPQAIKGFNFTIRALGMQMQKPVSERDSRIVKDVF